MLNRASKLQQVYAELRRALGSQVPAVDLLRLASTLVDASKPRVVTESEVTGGPRFALDQAPLDVAFADGGWRILARERRWKTESDSEDEIRLRGKHFNRREMELAA
jgi:hypothetical protein